MFYSIWILVTIILISKCEDTCEWNINLVSGLNVNVKQQSTENVDLIEETITATVCTVRKQEIWNNTLIEENSLRSLIKQQEVIQIDLSRYITKLKEEHEEFSNNETLIKESIYEYKKFLTMIKYQNTQNIFKFPLVPSRFVDLVWHQHILDTWEYEKDCNRIFGGFIHHFPAFNANNEEIEDMERDYDKTLNLYQQLFRQQPPQNIWIPSHKCKKGYCNVRCKKCQFCGARCLAQCMGKCAN